jgi:hypothetical protein
MVEIERLTYPRQMFSEEMLYIERGIRAAEYWYNVCWREISLDKIGILVSSSQG